MVGHSSRPRGHFRPFLERAALRPYVASVKIDEEPIARAVKPIMAEQDKELRRLRLKGMQHNEALLKCSQEFQKQIGEMCMQAVFARDQRVLKLIADYGDEAVFALRTLGVLDPPWLQWKSTEAASIANELASNLNQTRAIREYAMRARIVRTQTASSYEATRMRPRELALPTVEHVISEADVARLRNGETLVLDPNPALLSREGFNMVFADLLGIVKRKQGVQESNNPCNMGSWHGMLPARPSEQSSSNLEYYTKELLRKFVALPALVERHGWHRPLALPGMIQLGYYPGGGGARYRPHLDRFANEVDNRRELTFLVYVNVNWQPKDGGCLRLHPDPNHVGAGTTDVEPLAGRIVIFESGKQMHEVLESQHGCDRLALTLWVEYEKAWQQPTAAMMPTLQQ